MTELEQVQFEAEGNGERKTSIHEYEIVVESLLRDLEMCKAEQTRLRAELETLHRESNAALEIARESFSRSTAEECAIHENYKESLASLQNRISTMEKEKDSMFQLWQAAVKSVDTLEDQLKASMKDERTAKNYEERMNNLKETYSEAIKALEAKLLRAKENFEKHQSLWSSSVEKIESLTRDNNELEKKLSIMQNDNRANEETNRVTIERLKSELEISRVELEKCRMEKSDLQTKLQDTRIFATKIVAKDEESKAKILEAIELVETAVREKNDALQRESRALEDRAKIESRLNNIVDDYTERLNREINLAKENSERTNKEYVSEITELKAELREKVTILDRVQRENRLMEEELEKVRRGSEDFLQRSSASVLNLERKLDEAHAKIETCEENCRRKYEEKIRQGEERIGDLESRLAAVGDKLRRTQLSSGKEIDERIREADERAKEISERNSGLERRLARALDERENLACELRNLQANYDREIGRRDNERRSHEARIRELQDEVQNANDSLEKANARGSSLIKQIEGLHRDSQNKLNIVNGNESQTTNMELTLRLRTLQEKFDRKTRELSQHVEIHQKLCSRWKDEAKSLTTKFQIRSKELRDKVNILRTENEELNKELLSSRQQLALCRVQVLHRYDQGDGSR